MSRRSRVGASGFCNPGSFCREALPRRDHRHQVDGRRRKSGKAGSGGCRLSQQKVQSVFENVRPPNPVQEYYERIKEILGRF